MNYTEEDIRMLRLINNLVRHTENYIHFLTIPEHRRSAEWENDVATAEYFYTQRTKDFPLEFNCDDLTTFQLGLALGRCGINEELLKGAIDSMIDGNRYVEALANN